LVTSLEDLRLRISQMVPGSATKVKIARDGQEQIIEVTLGTLTENPNELFTGVNVTPLTGEARRRLGIADPRIGGLIITDIAEDSPFRERLAPDVIIIEVNRIPVPDLATAKSALRKNGENDLLTVFYRGQIRYAVVNAPKAAK
jgi:serine protease Do/serine protease DegQ